MKQFIICDIDGTIADPTHRRHHVENKPKNWKAFRAEAINDTPHHDILYTLRQFQYSHDIIFVTGRMEKERELTRSWLTVNAPLLSLRPIYMRKNNDVRSDDIVKEEILFTNLAKQGVTSETTLFVLDDRQRVVDMWRGHGFRVLQVAPGNF